MQSNNRGSRREPLAELFAHWVWILGALISYLAGAVIHPLALFAGLAVAFVVALLLAKISRGWSVVPAMFMTLSLQAPVIVAFGLYQLSLPIGFSRAPCFFWHGTYLELMWAVMIVVANASPIGFLVRLGPGGLHRLRRFARIAAPIASAATAMVVLLGAVRLARHPTPDRYLDSLPLHATIPAPAGQPCTPIENKRDPKHKNEWDREACATPDVDASPLSFHYHVESVSANPERKIHSLNYRTKHGYDRDIGLWFWRTDPPEVPVKRDDSIDAWLVPGRAGQIHVVSLNESRWRLYLREIRGHVSPPLGWSLAAGGGLLIALACFAASFGLRRLVGADTDARREWLAARHGDLSVMALACSLCASGWLLAALFAGFLT